MAHSSENNKESLIESKCILVFILDVINELILKYLHEGQISGNDTALLHLGGKFFYVKEFAIFLDIESALNNVNPDAVIISSLVRLVKLLLFTL